MVQPFNANKMCMVPTRACQNDPKLRPLPYSGPREIRRCLRLAQLTLPCNMIKWLSVAVFDQRTLQPLAWHTFKFQFATAGRRRDFMWLQSGRNHGRQSSTLKEHTCCLGIC